MRAKYLYILAYGEKKFKSSPDDTVNPGIPQANLHFGGTRGEGQINRMLCPGVHGAIYPDPNRASVLYTKLSH
jgi:hypothetical protein